MRTPKCEGAKQRENAADNPGIKEQTNSHLRRQFSREREVEKPAKESVSHEVDDDRGCCYSLKTLCLGGHRE